MRQELIDLYLGELEPAEAEALQARLKNDPELAREYEEIAGVMAFMNRGEEVEPSREARAAVLAEVARLNRPSLWQQLKQVPSLLRYRFMKSTGFRVAAISLGVHLIAMAVLFEVYLPAKPKPTTIIGEFQPNFGIQKPDSRFTARLRARRAPHVLRLRQFGIGGQGEAIREGLDRLVAAQRPDGSFGTTTQTAYAALALLAEGDCSAHGTRRGYVLERAIHHLLVKGRFGARHGAVLSALVEDYSLSYAVLDEEQRRLHTAVINRLIRAVEDDPAGQEGLALAKLAGFAVPETRSLGQAQALLNGGRAALLKGAPTRVAVTAVLAKGHLSVDKDRVRDWARPLFEAAQAEIEAGKVSGEAVLALQAVYRF